MTTRNKKLDLNQLAARIIGEATGDIEPQPELSDKEKAAIESGRLNKIKKNKAKNPQ